MIILLFRNPTSYFRPYRNYFIAIYTAFFPFPVRELALFYSPDETLLRIFTLLVITAATAIAVSWGHLATKLYLYPQPYPFRSILSMPRRPIQILFLLYLFPMAVTIMLGLLLPGTIDPSPGKTADYPASQAVYQTIAYSNVFLAAVSSIVVPFVAYPFLVLVRLRSQLKDEEVRHALRLIALSFGTISALLLLVNAAAAFGVSVIGIGHVISVGLLVVVVNAFRKPSFLKSFLGVVPSLEAMPSSSRSDRCVLIYSNNEERFSPISKYVSEGVSQHGLVIYFYKGDEAIVRDGLSHHGLNTRHHIMNGTLRLSPLSSLYQSEGVMDEEAAIGSSHELESEARTLGKEGLRLVVDFGDHAKRPSQKFVEHLADPRWTTLDHYVKVVMAFSKSAFEGQESALRLLRSKIPVLDLTEGVDGFSRTVGLTHSELAGKKILLEYDPQSNYEKVLKSLMAESASNFERIIVFTRVDSPSLSLTGEEPGLKIFIMTTRVSYPKMVGENRVLLPAYDASLLLDALNKTIEAFTGASFTVVFDSISHYIFTLGLDRTHSLVRQALELIVSDKITAVFLVNLGAHDQKTILTFENLFDLDLVCTPGVRVPRVRKSATLVARFSGVN